MEVLAVIPARGGSKGIPKKNIISLLGKPLIQYTIEAAKSSKNISKIVVSTDNKEIAKISLELGVEIVERPKELATDIASSQSAVNHAVNSISSSKYLPELICTLQPTSPLRDSTHIDEAIDIFKKNPKGDSLVSCIKVPHIFNPESIMRLNNKGELVNYMPSKEIKRRQEKEILYARNGAAIYLTKKSLISKFIYGGTIIPYIMKEKDSIDIDNYEDLKKAELYLYERLERNVG